MGIGAGFGSWEAAWWMDRRCGYVVDGCWLRALHTLIAMRLLASHEGRWTVLCTPDSKSWAVKCGSRIKESAHRGAERAPGAKLRLAAVLRCAGWLAGWANVHNGQCNYRIERYITNVVYEIGPLRIVFNSCR